MLRPRRRGVAALLALLFLLPTLPVRADEADDLQHHLSAIQQQQDTARAQLAQLAQQQARLRGLLDELRQRLRSATTDLEDVQRRVNGLQAQIDDAAARAKVAEESYRKRRAAFQTRARFLYKSGPSGWLGYVLGAGSFQELIQRTLYTQALASADARAARALAREQADLQRQQVELQQARDALQPLLEELSLRQAKVAQQYDLQASYNDALEQARRASLQQLAGLQAQEKALLRALDEWRERMAGKQPPRFAAQCPPAPASGYRFCGHGWGHGVGLGQWGAYGMAKAGETYVSILTYFYRGATFVTREDAPVNILLYTRGPFRAVGEGGPFHWTDAAGRHQGQPGTPVALTPGVRIDPDSSSTRFTLVSGERTRTYRGSLVGLTVGGTARVINVVLLEDYLRGLGEVPSSWPLEAIKAQVVAARCYALTHLSGGAYDMDDTTRYQVYGGVGYESGKQNAAVDATRGQALVYNGQPIIAFYSSSDGGHTANVWDVFGGSRDRYPYLEGVRDNFDVESPMHTWYTGVYSVETLEQVYFTPADISQWGHLRSLDLTRRDDSRRLRSVGLVATRGTKWISVAVFMDKFNDPRQPLTGSDALWNDMFGVGWSSGGWPHGW